MVKHNNVIPDLHFHKQWARRVRTWFDQPMRKKARRLRRAAKAAAIAPRPASGALRPVVRCPTSKYNTRLRAGRGFTVAELKAAGLSRAEARTIGIAVDHRRKNRSEEGFQANVERLNAYKARLVVAPRKKPTSVDLPAQLAGPILPIENAKLASVDFAPVTDELTAGSVAQRLRDAVKLKHTWGRELKKAQDAAELKAAKKKK